MRPKITNILDALDTGTGKVAVQKWIASFLCPVNPKIEAFLKGSAIDFAKRRISITYLISDADSDNLLGYFTLTHKPLLIDKELHISATMRRKLERYSRKDPDTGGYMASAFLIAQFGKNFALDNCQRLEGSVLMRFALDVLIDIQRQIGGGIVYLDCEDVPVLKAFYESERFKRFGERFSIEDDQHYIQYMLFL